MMALGPTGARYDTEQDLSPASTCGPTGIACGVRPLKDAGRLG